MMDGDGDGDDDRGMVMQLVKKSKKTGTKRRRKEKLRKKVRTVRTKRNIAIKMTKKEVKKTAVNWKNMDRSMKEKTKTKENKIVTGNKEYVRRKARERE